MSKINDQDYEVASSPRIVRLYDITIQKPFTASIVSYPGSNTIKINLFSRQMDVVQEVTLELDHGELIYSDKNYSNR
jgi:hypothetical protein